MEQIIKDTTANPAPLGLFGFGMTTILLNIHNAGFFELNSMIMAMGIFIGGVMEWKKGNGFGMAAFTSYGFFWLSLVAIWTLPLFGVTKPDGASMGFYLGLWGLFTLAFFIGTLNGNTIGKLMRSIADGENFQIPSTINDETIVDEIIEVLKKYEIGVYNKK